MDLEIPVQTLAGGFNKTHRLIRRGAEPQENHQPIPARSYQRRPAVA